MYAKKYKDTYYLTLKTSAIDRDYWPARRVVLYRHSKDSEPLQLYFVDGTYSVHS